MTVSSCPIVSRPNNTGTKAPTSPTISSVPKKMVAEPVYGGSGAVDGARKQLLCAQQLR